MKILPIYFPKIPIVSNWKPPRKRITVMRDGQPEVGSPKTKVRITIRITMIKAKIQDNSPPIKAIFSGASEKLTIPSIEYLNRDQKFQDVSPATRSTFLYSRYSVSNPTQAKIPFEKRLYSDHSIMASTMGRRIKRKSRAPSTISTWLI